MLKKSFTCLHGKKTLNFFLPKKYTTNKMLTELFGTIRFYSVLLIYQGEEKKKSFKGLICPSQFPFNINSLPLEF